MAGLMEATSNVCP